MLKVLFLVQDEQLANLDRLYDGVAAHCQCDLRRLSSDQQKDLKAYFKHIDPSAYDCILLILRSKKVMKQTRFLKKIPHLVFLEHDACQNYIKDSKYHGKFSKLYKALPGCTVIASGFGVTQKLCADGINAHFVPKGYDQQLLNNLNHPRDIDCAFIGSIQNTVYQQRAQFLQQLAQQQNIRVLQTAPGQEYLDTLNRIRFFISADVGLGEYMLKNFEAMACGCVVFAFDQGEDENQALGFRDMENIVLYRDLPDLLDKMAQVRSNPDLEATIRDAGQRLAESRFRFDLLGAEIVRTLESVLTSTRRPLRTTPHITVLIPYFGKWPAWFSFTLHSIRHNPNINWLFFTDCGTPDNAPANTTFIDISFADYCRLVSDRLQIDFAPSNPYKLCEIKPALGFIHQEMLAGADYWAFSDIDLIYGDLLGCFSQALVHKDVIATHRTRMSGHFSLLRNTESINRLFMKVPNWQQHFCSAELAVFDERLFSKLFIQRKNFPEPLFTWCNWLANPLFRRARFREEHTTPYCHVPWHDGSFDFPDYWVWDNGKIRNSADGNREFPYFHFMRWKKEEWKQHFSMDERLLDESSWMISTSGFSQLPSNEKS